MPSLSKMKIIKVQKNHLKICRPYIKTQDKSDILHAATCLQMDAVLTSNDRHFDRIPDEGIIEVWSTTKAIKESLSGVS